MIPAVGLCSVCRHAVAVRSSRGSTFWKCGLSDTDPDFPRYPRVPVLRCSGFRAKGGENGPDSPPDADRHA